MGSSVSLVMYSWCVLYSTIQDMGTNQGPLYKYIHNVLSIIEVSNEMSPSTTCT